MKKKQNKDTNVRVSCEDAKIIKRIAGAKGRSIKSTITLLVGSYIDSHTI